MLKQSQQQRLLQRLSPQQIQIMKLLQVPTANLEERIKEELEENPALEYGEEGDSGEDIYNNEADTASDDYEGESETADDVELTEDSADKVDLDDYLRGEDSGDYSDYGGDDYGSGADDSDRQSVPIKLETNFHDHLVDQLGMLDLDDRQLAIAEQIVGSIDDDGYLRREVHAIVDDLAFARNISTDVEEVGEILERIRATFDPPGTGAWTLQECLLLQLKRMPQTAEVKAASILLSKHFNEFIKKHYEKVQRQLGVDSTTFKQIITLITKLSPKPGAAFGSVNKAESYIIPDFFVYNNGGKLELTLNSKNAPELRVSEGYREMMRAYERGDKSDKRQREAVQFIKQKLDAAKWFIDAIKQRQHTLLHTMQAIIDIQHEFFLSGDETNLRPMILKDVAQRIGLDISTISRVANSKYVQTEFGTYKLKYFFSEGLQTESGEEVSTREVKSILGSLIEGEDKKHPLSDDRLTELLQEKGYNIARRTVAKYREQLNLPVARLRKEL